MAWSDDVKRILARLPSRFTLHDVYAFVPYLVERHPDNSYIEAKVRQVLQQLRDDGQLRFLGDGEYEQLQEEPVVEHLGIPAGRETTRAELSKMLGQAGDAALRRGMFKPASGPYRNHMFLFHNEAENPYGDVHEGELVRYVGQGMEGNQRLQSHNATLARHAEEGIQVHYFTQPRDKPGKIRYVGPVFVESYSEVFRPAEGRTVLEFTLLPAPSRDGQDLMTEYGKAMAAVTEYARPAGPIERPVVESVVSRRLRDRAFQRRVLVAYHVRCAICGDPLRKGTRHELEAAHIRAVNAGGPDELRNGLSLCKRHHWAFDQGFFTIDLSYRVEWLAEGTDPHQEIRDGAGVQVPEGEHAPHAEYLRWHKSQWVSI
jgi:hypothetical protein